MKNILTTLVLLLGLATYAQSSEATIVYSVGMDSEMTESLPADMFKNMTMTLSFKDNLFRNDFDMGMMKMSSINNGDRILTLFNAMGMKYATFEDGDESEMSLFNTKVDDGEDVKETGNTKTIAGYLCKEAIVSTDEGTVSIYFTDKIKPNTTNKEFDMGVNGFPLEFSIVASGMEMKITATSVKESANADFSMTIPEGYQKMDREQLKGMMR